MARYDGGWRGSPGPRRYDSPYHPHGGPRPRGPAQGIGWQGPPDHARDSGRSAGSGGGGRFSEAEELWDGAVHGPARYGLGPYYERLRSRRRSDDELREEVEEALFYDTWVDAEAIAVTVRDGVVTLRGELPDYDELRYATDDVWDVEGVRGVHSELTVQGESRSRREGVEGESRSRESVSRAGTEAEGEAASGSRDRAKRKRSGS